MLILHCPCCGVDVDETDLHAGGEAHLKREGPASTDEDFEDYLFMRENPKGVHFERWRHQNGCGKWFHMARDTTTLEVFGSYAAQTYAPPDDLIEIIKNKRPDWEGYGT